MSKIMELAEEYACAVAEDAEAGYTVADSATIKELMQIAVDAKERLDVAIKAEQDYTRAVLRERDELMGDLDRAKEDYIRACRLVAQMHEAAIGYVGGPNRGVVEDIADLHSERDQLQRALNDLVEATKQDRKELAELRLQIISLIGQEIDAEPKAEQLEPIGEVVQIDVDEDGQPSAWVDLYDDVELGTKVYAAPQDGLRKAAQMALEALQETTALCINYESVEEKDGCEFTESKIVIPMGNAAIEALREALNG